jgi:hypothetical protein
MSADNVGIKFDSALTIRVIDPAKAVTMLGIATNTAKRQSASRSQAGNSSSGNASEQFDLTSFYWNIVQQAKLALAIIIGNNKLNQSFKSTSKSSPVVVAHEVNKGGAESKRTNPEEEQSDDEGSFKQHIHDLFMMKFSENMSGE